MFLWSTFLSPYGDFFEILAMSRNFEVTLYLARLEEGLECCWTFEKEKVRIGGGRNLRESGAQFGGILTTNLCPTYSSFLLYHP